MDGLEWRRVLAGLLCVFEQVVALFNVLICSRVLCFLTALFCLPLNDGIQRHQPTPGLDLISKKTFCLHALHAPSYACILFSSSRRTAILCTAICIIAASPICSLQFYQTRFAFAGHSPLSCLQAWNGDWHVKPTKSLIQGGWKTTPQHEPSIPTSVFRFSSRSSRVLLIQLHVIQESPTIHLQAT